MSGGNIHFKFDHRDMPLIGALHRFAKEMKRFPTIVAAAIIAFLAPYPVHGEGDDRPIRQFSIATIEKLGQELYQRDSLAAAATDLLFETHPEAKEMRFGGWLTEIGDTISRVYLFKRSEDGIKQGYVAVFAAGKQPTIEKHLDEAIPEQVQIRLQARTTAKNSIPGFYDRPYNFEVLDDPDGNGFLVYSLAATKDPDEVVVGGHSRVTVSADAKTVESVDALAKSLLILRRPKNLDEGVQAMVVSHVVSDTPIETHVFVSLLHKKTIYVTTGKEIIWEVSNGSITKVPIKEEQVGDAKGD